MIGKSFLAIIFISLLCAPLIWSADIVDNGTEIWDLKERWVGGEGKMPHVLFPHTFHQEKNDYVCTKCHDDGGGPIKLPGKIEGITYSNAAHNFCWTCHLSKDVKQVAHTCSKCHTSEERVTFPQ